MPGRAPVGETAPAPAGIDDQAQQTACSRPGTAPPVSRGRAAAMDQPLPRGTATAVISASSAVALDNIRGFLSLAPAQST